MSGTPSLSASSSIMPAVGSSERLLLNLIIEFMLMAMNESNRVDDERVVRALLLFFHDYYFQVYLREQGDSINSAEHHSQTDDLHPTTHERI